MRQTLAGGDSVSTKNARRLLGRRRTGGVAVALAAVLMLGGCADGTHPGAAAVVGDTEISVRQVDETSRAVSAALGGEVSATQVLVELVRTDLIEQSLDRRSLSMSPAELAKAQTELERDPQVLNPEVADRLAAGGPSAQGFLDDFVRSALGTVKLGGGSSITDTRAITQGRTVLEQEAKSINVVVSPRFGKWTGEEIAAESGSISVESAQTKARREQQAPREQQQQEQPQG